MSEPALTTRYEGCAKHPVLTSFTIFSRKPPVVCKLLQVATLARTNSGIDQKIEYLSTEQVAQNISIPETQAISIEESQTSAAALEGLPVIAPEEQVFIADQTDRLVGAAATSQAVYNTSLPFPDKPSVPNKLVCMVLSAHNELIPDAIVEIRKSSGSIERAVKSNALGQFFITTPLANGEYVVEAEKDELQFPSQSIVLTGTPVDPIEIRSTA